MEPLIRFDWAIKHLLRNKANFDILEGFLSALLREEIRIINLLESESNQEDEADKFNRVDLLTENQRQELILIEVQVKSELDFFHRIAYGTAKLLTEHLEKGQAYRHLKKVISVSITYFNLGTGQDYLYYGSTNFIGVHTQDTLELSETQSQEYGLREIRKIFPEYYLIRVGKFADEIHDPLDEWIYMLKHSQIKPDFTAKHIQQAGEKLRMISLPTDHRKAYERFMENRSYEASMLYTSHKEGLQQGIKQGLEQGLEQGIEQGIQQVAKKMLGQGMEIEMIATLTGLSLETIEQLSKN
jgi:predicted transposase/invertase (TIGR01784 family)